MSRRNQPGQATAPPSGQAPGRNLAQVDVEAMAEELVAYHGLFADLFARREQREWSAFYLRGQLSELERKTVEPMVLALNGTDAAAVRAVQQFLGEGAWDDDAILARHQQLVGEDLGQQDGIVIFDGSGFPKQGKYSVGVARQYCGAVGKVANCQHGVFAAYASGRGYTFLDRRLYMPEHWFDQEHAQRRQRCGVPKELRFKTEPELALEMLAGLVERDAVPFQWVVVDEHYGMHPSFLQGVAALGKWYLAEVPLSTKAWTPPPQVQPPTKGSMGRPRKHPRVGAGQPKAKAVRQIAAELAPSAWKRYTIKEGSKGPIDAQFAFVRGTLARRRRPVAEVWIVFRRPLGQTDELKVFLSNAPESCARKELVRVSGLRWPVESAIEEAKGQVGMDHYETRTWRGWHHHMTQTFLAHYFLVRMRLKLKKSPGHDRGTSPGLVSGGPGSKNSESERGDPVSAVLSAT